MVAAIERRRRPSFDVSGYVDPYPERVLNAAERKLAGGAAGAVAPVAMNDAARKRLQEEGGAPRPRSRARAKGPASVRSLPVEPKAASVDERPSETMQTRG
jgi:hypothetical protein